jgi:hypothetical protein
MLTRPVERFRVRIPAELHRLAIVGAWFFVLVSLAHLAWVVGVKWSNPAGLTTLYQTTVDDTVHRAWGLAYDGTGGLMLALFQMGLVFSALFVSTLRFPRPRRLGHAVLVAWSALWALDLVWLASLDGQPDSWAQASIVALLFGCTAYRALTARRAGVARPDRGGDENASHDPTGVANVEAAQPAFGQEHVTGSARVTEIAPSDDDPGVRANRFRDRWRPLASASIRRGSETARQILARSKPIALRAGRQARGIARRTVQWLRRNGVIPTGSSAP